MACSACDPNLTPAGARRGEGHLAVRFDYPDRLFRVFKDGEQIDDCYEVDVDAGKAWRYEVPYRLCECGDGAAAYIDSGSFAVAAVEAGV